MEVLLDNVVWENSVKRLRNQSRFLLRTRAIKSGMVLDLPDIANIKYAIIQPTTCQSVVKK